MGYSLKDRNVLVTAGSRGLGALVAEKFAAEGANVAINYVSNLDRAKETVAKINSQYKVKTAIIQGDAGKQVDCVRVVKSAIEELGGLDIIVSNAVNNFEGWTKFAPFDDLYALEEEDWDKCWSVNVKGHLFLLREAISTFKANPDGGVFLITSSTAGLTPSGSSMAYSVAKSATVHLTKCLAKSQGPKVRVNAVCPGLLLTEWGSQFSKEAIDGYRNATALKAIPEVEDTADLFISLAKNTSMTGQAVAIDCGFTIAK